MKKILTLLVSFIFILSISGCLWTTQDTNYFNFGIFIVNSEVGEYYLASDEFSGISSMTMTFNSINENEFDL